MTKKLTLGLLIIILLVTGCTQQPDEISVPTPSVTPTPMDGPPQIGDWVIKGEQTVENQTITLNGNLIVASGGRLTLRNVRLIVNASHNGEFGISVEPEGSMFVYESIITAADLEHGFSFTVDGDAFEMRGSELHGVGWGPNDPYMLLKMLFHKTHQLGIPQEWGTFGLLDIGTSNAVIEGNLISYNYGVIALQGSQISLSNNTMHSNTGNPVMILGGEAYIAGNEIRHSVPAGTYGSVIALLGHGNNVIKDNHISGENTEGEAGGLLGIAVEPGFSNSRPFNNTIANNTINLNCTAIRLGGVSSNNTITGNIISSEEAGIYIHGSSNKIEGNTITSSGTGIDLTYSYNNVIANNVISDTVPGKHGKEPEDGIRIHHSSDNHILNNQISQVASSGILMWGSSKNNRILGNKISSAYRGVFILYGSDGNQVSANEILGTASSSIVLDDTSGNIIYGNNFIEYGEKPFDNGVNQWYQHQTGNYWSDYSEADANGDGIGEKPYSIHSNGVDDHPLMRPVPIELALVPEPEPVLYSAPNPEIRIGKTEEWNNKTVTLDTSLTIASGSRLTLTNVKLVLGNESHPAWIYIESGGELHIINSTVTDTERGYGGQLRASQDSTFVMRDSHWQGMYYDWWNEGFSIWTDRAIIEDNTLEGVSIMFRGTSSARVVGNTIQNTMCPMIVFGSSNSIIENNIIRNSIHTAIVLHEIYGGEKARLENNSIIGNQISNSWFDGIAIYGGKRNIVKHNKVSNILFAAVSVDEKNNTVEGNVIIERTN